MGWWTNDELAGLYGRLLDAGVRFVVVGGQAVNLWSENYRDAGTLPRSQWAELEPFASHDLDCLGGSIDAADAARTLGVEAEFYDPFGRTAVPNAGTLSVPLGENTLLIHFTHTVYGANRDEVRRTARLLAWRGRQLPVMHPLICLESKLDCLFGLDQSRRQDLKHVKLSCFATHEFFCEQVEANLVRDVLAACERIAGMAMSENGLRAWMQHGLECERAIPSDAITAAAARESKFANFLRLRWPRFEDELRHRRERHREIFSRKT